MEREVLSWAKEYHQKGYTVIPLEAKGKKPVIKWQRHQKERPTLDEVEVYFADSRRNIAVLTGVSSNLFVVDVDVNHGGDIARYPCLMEGHLVRTGSGGWHSWFSYGSAGGQGNTVSLLGLGMDTRGEGGYVAAPPSITTGVYSWHDQAKGLPESKCLPRLPDEILKLLLFKKKPDERASKNSNSKAGSIMPVSFLPATEGSRNHTAARVAGSIARGCGSYGRGYEALRLWNYTSCIPSLPESELKSVWESIWRKNLSGRGQ